MSSANTRTGRQKTRRNLPADADTLLNLLIKEIEAPADMQTLLEQMPATTNCREEASQLLKAKDRFNRRESYLKSEPMWFNKYGWFMARIVGLFGILVFIYAMFTRGVGVDFTISMILGAACYYLLLVTLSNIKYRDKNRKRQKLVQREEQRYQRDIVPIAAALMKRFDIDPQTYPLTNPTNKAGLEENEKGIFIPVD